MAFSDMLAFGPFRFEPHTGRLTKRGFKIKLQPKAAAALTCLLEQPGEVVSRAHLQASLWPDGTNVDFELGIKGAIKKLRDALSDVSDEPTYIQTVHGEGYRFLAPVSAVAAESNGRVLTMTPVADVAAAGPDLVIAAPGSIRRRTLWLAVSMGVAAVLISAFFIARPKMT